MAAFFQQFFSSSRLDSMLMCIHVASQKVFFFLQSFFMWGVSDACTYDVTWKTLQLNSCEKEPPVIYCAWSLPCRSASAATYGGNPFHLPLADCWGLLPCGRGGPGGPRCTVVVVNSWVGRGAAGLHGGGSAGARAGSFQWQCRGAGDGLIKTLADGLGYGTHVCAQPHDARPSQLMAREREGHRPRVGEGCCLHCSWQWEGRSCLVGTGVGRHPSRWSPAKGLLAVPTAEAGGPAVKDWALSAAQEWSPWSPALLQEDCREGQQARDLCTLSPGLAYSSVSRGHRELEECCGCTVLASPGEQGCMASDFICALVTFHTGKLGRSTAFWWCKHSPGMNFLK